jgi:hypothetical protein
LLLGCEIVKLSYEAMVGQASALAMVRIRNR